MISSNIQIRHDFSREKISQHFEITQKELQISLEMLPEPHRMPQIGDRAMEVACLSWVLEGDKSKFMDYLRLSHLAMTWHWKALVHPGPHKIRLPEKKVFEFGESVRSIDSHLGTWVNGLDLAIIFRDQAAIDVYTGVPNDFLIHPLSEKLSEYADLSAQFRKSALTEDVTILDLLGRLFEAASAEKSNPSNAEKAQKRLIPLIKLYERLFRGGNTEFNQTLTNYLELWKSFFAEKDRGPFGTNLVSTAAISTSAFAYENGYRIKVHSEYLPLFLVEGDFQKVRWPDPNWIDG